MKKSKGITIIALIITIIVMIILAGVVLATLSGDSGPITKAQEATIMSELSRYKEELELYKIEKYSENLEFEEETLTAGKNVLVYNTQKQEEVGKANIKTIIPDISDTYLEKIEVIKGELLINTPIDEEIRVAKNLGIKVNPYDIRDGVLWSSNGNLALLGEETGSITIPDSVTAIGEGAFANVEGLKTIIIPSTVKRIEQNAFNGNQTLEKVIMQEKINEDGTIEGVEYIGNKAFAECPNLTTVQMANSVKEVGNQIFYGDRKLENINISKNLKIINSYMFSDCINLTNIEIPEGVTRIIGYAFRSCTNLNKIKIPSTMKSIDGTAFNNCPNLTNIEIAEENDNFEFKNNILLAKLGENETEMVIILESAIKDNTLVIPDTVINLKNEQLLAFNNITKVEVPASVENIDGYFFNNNITNIVINSENPKYEVIDNAIYTKQSYGEDIEIVRYFGNESNVRIKDKTKVIKRNCFKSKSNITNIELPDSIEEIEQEALSRMF